MIDTMPADSRGDVSTTPTISVVVCTYNRAGLLPTVLHSLCAQAFAPSAYEIIVVDNNSTDLTASVAEEFCERYPNVHYCFEPRQGLSHARNRGYQEARGAYVGYIDDDSKAPENWLATAQEIIDTVGPGMFGGPYFAFYNTPKPRWFRDAYGTHEEGDQARIVPAVAYAYLSGGNVFFRRSLLDATDGFDASLGMVGDKVAYGEETALQRYIQATMPDELVYYDPRLCTHHLVQAHKMRLGWSARQRFVVGRYIYQVFGDWLTVADGRRALLIRAARTLLAFGLDLGWGAMRRDRARYPFYQNYLYERSFLHLESLGKLYEHYCQIAQENQQNHWTDHERR